MKKRNRWVASVAGLMLLAMGACSSNNPSGTPAANAGPDQKVLLASTVTLDGSGSTGVGNAGWTFVSKPAGSTASLTKADTLTPTFTADVVGDYVVKLQLNGDAALADTVAVTSKAIVANIANGSGSTVTERTRFGQTEFALDLGATGGVLSGEASQGTIASYKWEQLSGPTATVTGDGISATLAFTGPSFLNLLTTAGAFKWQPLPISIDATGMLFRLTVTDASGNTDIATTTVYMQDAGTAIHEASGLPNVGTGTVVYLQGPTNRVCRTACISVGQGKNGVVADWAWTLATVPTGSTAVFADSGTTTSTIQFPKFTPDIDGFYVVNYSTTTPETVTGTITINAGKWVGVGTVAGTTARNPQCGTCHNGNVEPDKMAEYNATKHATTFENSYTTFASLAPEPYLWPIKTVGYNTSAANNGFDDLITSTSTDISAAPATFAEFAAAHPTVAALSNVQCENCHGPGSLHSGDPARIAQSFSQFGTCGQCHHEEAQWLTSAHNSNITSSSQITLTGISSTTGLDSPANYYCTRCHTTKGFSTYIDPAGGMAALGPVTETGTLPGVGCVACHDPHNADNPNQLRLYGNVTMIIDDSVVNAGKAAVCYTCHDGNRTHGVAICDPNGDGKGLDGVSGSFPDTDCGAIGNGESELYNTATLYNSQVHDNPQGTTLEGKGTVTDLDGNAGSDANAVFTLGENSFHGTSGFVLANVTGDSTLPAENNKCVTCHMATAPTTSEEAYNHVGGHAFKMVSGEVEHTSACTPCHLTLTAFNRTARADYDGDGVVEGVQDEIKGLLLNVTRKLRAVDAGQTGGPYMRSTGGTTTSGGVITVSSISWGTSSSNAATKFGNVNNSKAFRAAVWNYKLVVREGSLGIHNTAFDVQTLQKTYTAISKMFPTAKGGGPTAVDGDTATGTAGGSYATDFPLATIR